MKSTYEDVAVSASDREAIHYPMAQTVCALRNTKINMHTFLLPRIHQKDENPKDERFGVRLVRKRCFVAQSPAMGALPPPPPPPDHRP